MTTLYSLAKRLEVGDHIILKAIGSEVNDQTPKVVTEVQQDDQGIRIEAKGPRDGKYALKVDQEGHQEAFRLSNGHEEKRGPAGTVGIIWKNENQSA